jgi:hypothetical protein
MESYKDISTAELIKIILANSEEPPAAAPAIPRDGFNRSVQFEDLRRYGFSKNDAVKILAAIELGYRTYEEYKHDNNE